jgi:chromosome segregation protein
VDAALGPWVEAVVVDSFQVAERCRKFLEETQAGRVLFLMKDRLPHKSPTVGSTHSNGCIPLIQRVGITPHLAPILDFLLADTWLAPNREEAIAFLHKQNGQTSMRVVTPEGELITSTSAWLGGRVGQEHLVIGRIGRLQTLEVALAHVEEQLAEVRERLTSGQTQRQTQWETLQTLEDRIRQEQEAIHGIQAHLDSAQVEEDRLARELDLLHAERLEASQELDGLRTQLNRAEAEQADWDRQVAEAEAALNGYREAIAQTLRTREAISIELAEARAKWASLEQVVQSRKTSWMVLEESMGSLEGRIAREREELGEWEQKEVQWQKDCMDLEQELGRMEASIEDMKGHLEEAQRHRAQAIEAAQVEEEACSVERRRLEQLRERLHAEAMEQAQTAFEKEQILTRMQQLYGMEWKDIEQVDVQEPAQADGSYPEADMDAMRTRIEELSRTIQRMGPVNLGSIEEEQELKARYEYLVAQRDDLVKARQDLHEALTKINRTARAMFRETFQAIQKEFQVAFKELFGGGEARLTLIDEEDVLESGIEIIARPPGKPLQPISLLSGGEKALTTIALLFAIFRIKPSPFCLMDEIDAPLDEANIDRFTRALKGFLKDSQFVIITHNKKTISMADLVYGITMEERGVSKLVSVKFKEKASENGLSSNGNGFKAGEIASDPTRSLPDPRSPAPSPPATA